MQVMLNTEYTQGEDPLTFVDHYKYLGVIFEEHLNFETCAGTLAAPSRGGSRK